MEVFATLGAGHTSNKYAYQLDHACVSIRSGGVENIVIMYVVGRLPIINFAPPLSLPISYRARCPEYTVREFIYVHFDIRGGLPQSSSREASNLVITLSGTSERANTNSPTTPSLKLAANIKSSLFRDKVYTRGEE